MAWKHKTLRDTGIIIGSCVFEIDSDGCLSPDPEDQALADVTSLPDFSYEAPVVAVSKPSAPPKKKEEEEESAPSKPKKSKPKKKKE